MMPTERERIAILETRMAALDSRTKDMDGKLDDLLALRHKGVGAFWLASSLTGAGIIGMISLLWNWLSK